MKKKVEDLVYPDVVEITSAEQTNKILKHNRKIYNYRAGVPCYLIGRAGKDTGWGSGSREAYEGHDCGSGEGNYVVYKFEDLIFPEVINNSYEIY